MIYAIVIAFMASVVCFVIAAWYLDRDTIRAEGGYDIRNPWHYRSTILAMWTTAVLFVVLLLVWGWEATS